MADLKSLYDSLGFTHVQTYVQSGNVIFNCSESDHDKVARMIEAKIHRDFGFDIPVFIRSAADFQRLVDDNPFTHSRNQDPAKLHVTFLNHEPEKSDLMELVEYKDPTDEYVIQARVIFLYCPNGYGRTKLSNTFFEKKLSVIATTRNWKTVTALLSMAKTVSP